MNMETGGQQSANPEVWDSLKREFGDRYDQQYMRSNSRFRIADGYIPLFKFPFCVGLLR